jgi:hypothetical protein
MRGGQVAALVDHRQRYRRTAIYGHQGASSTDPACRTALS